MPDGVELRRPPLNPDQHEAGRGERRRHGFGDLRITWPQVVEPEPYRQASSLQRGLPDAGTEGAPLERRPGTRAEDQIIVTDVVRFRVLGECLDMVSRSSADWLALPVTRHPERASGGTCRHSLTDAIVLQSF